jgi:hypothetical protein
MEPAKIQKKIGEILEEFFEAQEIDDTITCFKKAKISESFGIPGVSVVLQVYETTTSRKKDSDWVLAGKLLAELWREELISEEDCQKGTPSLPLLSLLPSPLLSSPLLLSSLPPYPASPSSPSSPSSLLPLYLPLGPLLIFSGFDSFMEIFADVREDTPIAWKRISHILGEGLKEGYWKLQWYVGEEKRKEEGGGRRREGRREGGRRGEEGRRYSDGLEWKPHPRGGTQGGLLEASVVC